MKSIILAGLLCGMVAAAQDRPQFGSRTEALVIDVSVIDKQRRPVHGLTLEDFEVLEDGQPRPLLDVRWVELPAVEPAAASWHSRVPTDAFTNDWSARRLVVVLIDDTSMMSLFARNQAKTFAHALVDQLGPTDLAAVLFTGQGGVPQEFTTDRARLHAAIETFKWQAQRFYGLVSLRKLSAALGAVPDLRKIVFYVSTGADLDMDALSNALTPQATHASRDLVVEMQAFIREAQRANVTVYGVDLNGLVAGPADDIDPTRNRREFLQIASNETGGRAVVNLNTQEDAIPRILEENGSYYVLGFTCGPGQTEQAKSGFFCVTFSR